MDEGVTNYARKEILEAMYKSVERMNQHVVENNPDATLSEQHLQVNLRRNFRELQER
ncbi:MAG: hypothetical protein GF334_02465 [Candidatus Altiarchaeales archaeon]|nr:hypothetical protein [Candidatus Altiarchaeales archaeon]